MKPLPFLLLSSYAKSAVSFTGHSHDRQPAATAQPAVSLAYSFRHPPEDETSSSILSDANNTNGKSLIDANNDEMDIVGSGTLGDIMSGTPDTTQPTTKTSSTTLTSNNDNNPSPSSSKVIDGLVTKEGGELNTRYNCNFTPMERIALTSNGNLQRIFSSYYDAPVHVHIDFCERRSSSSSSSSSSTTATAAATTTNIKKSNGDGASVFDMENDTNTNTDTAIWDRVVHIHIHSQTICKATSIISVKDPTCIQLIENGTIGLGQLFRYLNRLPTFSLLDAGRTTSSSRDDGSGSGKGDDVLFDGGIWRTYELKCEEMTCLIHEEFHKDAWNISPLGGLGVVPPMI